MAKLTLEIEAEYDFNLIGICSHVKDYRLSWEINQNLEFDLQKSENLELNITGEFQSYSFFSYIDEENFAEYYLINNRSEYGTLIPEEKKTDYFLLIKGAFRKEQKSNLLKKITKLNPVLTCYEVIVEELKSKDNLLF